MQIKRLSLKEEVVSLIDSFNSSSKYIALDIETDSLLVRQAKILSIQVIDDTGDTAYIFPGVYAICLTNIQVRLVLQNFKYDYSVLFHNSVDITDKPYHDIMLLDHLVDENREHGLNARIQAEFRDNYKEVFWAKYKDFKNAPEEEQDIYACKDVWYTRELYRYHLKTKLPGKLVKQTHDLSKGLLRTELEGLRVDQDYLITLAKDLSQKISEAKPKMRKSCKDPIELLELEYWSKAIDKYKTDKRKALVTKPEFNFDSSSQLQDLIYGVLELPQQFDPKTKNPTLNEEALEALEKKHPLIPLLLDYRKVNKIYTSFIEGTLERLENGRVYPEFHVNGTVTGRLSSSNPNMQQLPTDGGIRGLYIPDNGHCFIAADFSQLEVTIAAHFTRDKNLLKVVNDGASLHDITATSLGLERSTAKTVNFAMQYGASHFKIARILGCSKEDAKIIYDKYWETYSGIKQLMDKCSRMIDRGEPIVNPFGRARHFPKIKRNPWDKAYRQAFNFLIQSTGADLTNSAYSDMVDKLAHIGRPLFPIHDEIISQVKEDKYEEAKEIIVSTMERSGEKINFSLPLRTSCSKALTRWEK